MGQRGPAPEPARLKLLKGETRPSQVKRGAQPQNPPTKPKLSPDAEEVWDRILAATADTSHIGETHVEVYRQFCETAATLNAMQPKGSKEWRELVLVNLRLARELCLTPATGTALNHTKPAERKLDRYVRPTG